MNSIFGDLRAAARKRAAYNRTVKEISALSNETAWDIGIYPGDAHRLAREAVYGR